MTNDSSADLGTREYRSPLREAQTARTRDLILDALTSLLGDRSPDEISMKDIATAAEVAERTVYRHFPDRRSLHDGLAERAAAVGSTTLDESSTLDWIAAVVPSVYRDFEEHEALTRAAVLLNADPRRIADDSHRRSEIWLAAVARTFPDLSHRQHVGIAAMTRILGSSQTWLRLREQFGMDADEAGGLAAWAMQAMANEARTGNPPPINSRSA